MAPKGQNGPIGLNTGLFILKLFTLDGSSFQNVMKSHASEGAVAELYSERGNSSPQPHALFLFKIHFNILSNYSQVPQVVSYLPIRFNINVPYTFLVSPLCVTCLAFSILLDFITIIIPRKEYNSYYAPLYILILLHPLFEAKIFSSAVYSLTLQQIA
jgi:hypothetical protein